MGELIILFGQLYTYSNRILLITLSPAEQVSKRPGRYDEMPKSSTMDARHALLEQQFYATVQRQKTPALTPFSSSGGYEVDTIEQLKRAVRSQVTDIYLVTDTCATLCKYLLTFVKLFPPISGWRALSNPST